MKGAGSSCSLQECGTVAGKRHLQIAAVGGVSASKNTKTVRANPFWCLLIDWIVGRGLVVELTVTGFLFFQCVMAKRGHRSWSWFMRKGEDRVF